MSKKFWVIAILCLVLLGFSGVSQAAVFPGTYQINGTMKVSLKLMGNGGNLFDINLNLSDLSLLQEKFTFASNKTFKESLGIFKGTWVRTKSKFNVNVKLEDLFAQLATMGIIATERPESYFKGVFLKNGSIKGDISVIIDLSGSLDTNDDKQPDMNLAGSLLELSGSYTGVKPIPLAVQEELAVSDEATSEMPAEVDPKAFVHTIVQMIKERLQSVPPRALSDKPL